LAERVGESANYLGMRESELWLSAYQRWPNDGTRFQWPPRKQRLLSKMRAGLLSWSRQTSDW